MAAVGSSLQTSNCILRDCRVPVLLSGSLVLLTTHDLANHSSAAASPTCRISARLMPPTQLSPLPSPSGRPVRRRGSAGVRSAMQCLMQPLPSRRPSSCSSSRHRSRSATGCNPLSAATLQASDWEAWQPETSSHACCTCSALKTQQVRPAAYVHTLSLKF